MNKYTIQGQKVDSKIQEHMDLIVKVIKEYTLDVLSIILAGSFGQGEGAAKLINDKIFPFNDYDVYIITGKKLKSNKIRFISEKISKELNSIPMTSYKFEKDKRDFENTFYIDLKSFSLGDFKKILPRLRNYSMKRATTILYGKDYRYLIPDYKLEDIPLSDPAKLLLDRMNQLVEYYSIGKDFNPELISYKIQTAYSACATALLMLSRKFDSSYVKSMKVLNETYEKDFQELYKKIPNLHIKLKKYISWKLNPKKPVSKDMKKELFKTIEDILEVAKYFFSKFLDKKILDEDDLSQSILEMSRKFYGPYLKKKFSVKSNLASDLLLKPASLFLKYKYFLNVKKSSGKYYFRIFFNKYTPDLYISASTPYLISYVINNNQKRLNKLATLIKKIYPTENKTWEKLSLDYRKAYLSFFLQDF